MLSPAIFWRTRDARLKAALEGGFGFGGAGVGGEECGGEHEKGENEARNAAEVVGEGAAGGAGEEDTAAHDVEMEERGEKREDADGDEGAGGRGGTDGAMGEPVEELGEAGDGDDDAEIAEEMRADGEGSLLQSGIEAGGGGDVTHFDEHDEEAAMDVGVEHGAEVDERTDHGAHESTLPVPAGEGLPRQAFGTRHGTILRRNGECRVTAELQVC